MTTQSKLFKSGDTVKLNWNEIAKDWGTDKEEIQNTYFKTKKANDYALYGNFIVKSIFAGGTYDNGNTYQICALVPETHELTFDDFLNEDVILDTAGPTIESILENGYILMENENLTIV